MAPSGRLTTGEHDRDSAGLRYVYPVVSRRAGGVSVGINLNTNNACNWRCVYCQVPGLVLGKAPEVELGELERELHGFVGELLNTDWMERNVPAGARTLRDFAFSGNGEPTSSPQFAQAIDTLGRVLGESGLAGRVPVVLITNGSLTHRPEVQAGLEKLARLGGRVWFKLDAATDEGVLLRNNFPPGAARARTNLAHSARLCPTWVQTCVFRFRGEAPSESEQEAYVEFLRRARAEGSELQGVLLYGLARESHQPEAAELEALPREWLEAFAERIRASGLPVDVSL